MANVVKRDRRRGFRLAPLCALAFAAMALCFDAGENAWSQPAEEQAFTEYRIKAVFLQKFASYVEWPEAGQDTRAPIRIGVWGSPAVVSELEQILPGRMIGNRPLSVHSVDGRQLPGDLNILFVARGEGERLAPYVNALQERSVLVVTESEGMLKQGGIINFVIVDQRVKFSISLEAAAKSKLKLSSRLLAVAYRVLGPS